MIPFAIAASLFLTPAAEAAAPAAQPAAEAPMPTGAPTEDYPFVAWCYGVLSGYLDLHDQVMPEVTRIETAFRPPNRKLSDDLKVYADMQKEGRTQLKQFQAALTAAEKASLKPINILGAAAVSKGADVWRVGPDITPARLAQAWMSWDLPARCEVTSKDLLAKATLMGGAFKINDQPEPPAAEADAPPPADAAPAAPADAPVPAPASEQPAAPPPETPTPNPQ
jgi:hypothetical protein